MNKLIVVLLFFVSGIIGTTHAQSSKQSIKGVDIDRFSGISLSGKLSVELIPSGKDSITIDIYDIEMDKLKWGVSKGILSVSLKTISGNKGRGEVKIYISEPPLTLSAWGSEVLVRNTLSCGMTSFTISGGGKLTAAIDCRDFELTISGNSAAKLSGAAKYLTIIAWESSSADARQLESVAAKVEASTGAEVFVWATERAVLTAKTGASIFYRGNPAILKENISKIGLGATINSIGQ